MRATRKEKKHTRRNSSSSSSSSPARDRSINSASNFELRPSSSSSSHSPRATSLLNNEFVTETISEFDDNTDSFSNPRSFSYSVKQQCWDKAEKIKGRDPDRWRRDYLGNIVFRKLVGCPGCLCHDYDHIVPFSKGGKSTLENCQVLQARVNRSKGNRMDISRDDLIQRSSYCLVRGRDMDLLELSAFGNVRRGEDSGWCSIQ